MSARTFKPGDPVVITAGLSKGLEGRIVEKWHNYAKGIAAYRVDLGGLLRDRVIRADFIAPKEGTC